MTEKNVCRSSVIRRNVIRGNEVLPLLSFGSFATQECFVLRVVKNLLNFGVKRDTCGSFQTLGKFFSKLKIEVLLQLNSAVVFWH